MPSALARNRSAARAKRTGVEHQIAEATETLLNDRSFRELTVDHVMASTGLVRTAFYRYFPDLESVLLRLLEELVAEVDAGNDWLTAPDDADFRALLRLQATNLTAIFAGHARLLAALLDATDHPKVREVWQATIDRFRTRATARVVDLNARGVTHVEHPAETVSALFTMLVHYLIETFSDAPRRAKGPVIETISEIWYRSLCFDGPTPTRR
jgi:AcrR family transcriptional regulator